LIEAAVDLSLLSSTNARQQLLPVDGRGELGFLASLGAMLLQHVAHDMTGRHTGRDVVRVSLLMYSTRVSSAVIRSRDPDLNNKSPKLISLSFLPPTKAERAPENKMAESAAQSLGGSWPKIERVLYLAKSPSRSIPETTHTAAIESSCGILFLNPCHLQATA
jgi:hypothetical protein